MAEQNGAAEKRLSIIKIYVKDLSFESPQAPGVFQIRDWAPQTNMNLRSSHTKIDDNIHEVILTITIDTKAQDDEKTLFLVELQQAGLFEIAGQNEDELGLLVGSLCPNLLFPYAREAIANLVQRGGFPEFLLQPINFDVLYAQSLEQLKQQGEAGSMETH